MRQEFTFQSKTKVVFGLDTVETLGDTVDELGAERVLIVTDQGIRAAGVLEQVERPLADAGIEYAIFDEIEPNPTDATIVRGAGYLNDVGADAVIGVGGGSPMDAAKAMAMVSENDGDVEAYCGAVNPWPNAPKPIIAIPTTAGTGSEVSAAAMVNVPARGRKMDLFGRSLLPSVAIVDPRLTLSLPPRLTALTGVDALCHAVEAYVCARANPISDAIAERAISLVAGNLRQAYANGRDLEARSKMLLASTMAVIAASNAGGLGIIHSMAQTIGGYYDLPHGLTIAVCFPYGLEYNVIAVPEKYATVARLLGADTASISHIAAAKTLPDIIRDLLDDLDIHDDVRSMGVERDDIPTLAELSMLDGSTPVNPRVVDEAGFEALFERAYAKA